ncbi:MAG: hypothetical protein FD138_124 [Planctomycetota bacterium]|nr:MAG: hypothetical protein FD138_124 [Planctomycetota bacterium]
MRRQFLRAPRRRTDWLRSQIAEVQQFEARTLPAAGVLNVVQSGSNFTLTGDAQANAVTVEVKNSVITITAGEGTMLKLQGVPHSKPITITLAGTIGDLKINLGGGQDQLNLNVIGNVSLGGTLAVNSGSASDAVSVTIPGTLSVKGTVSFLTSDGDDTLNITGSGAATFQNTLKIDSGMGADTLNVALNGGLTVKAAATITTGGGQDQINLSNTKSTLDFQKGLSVDAGADSNAITIAGDLGTLHCGGNLTVVAGSSNDKITLMEKLLVDGNLSVTTGDGQDDLLLVTTTGVALGTGIVANVIQGNILFDTGTGADILTANVAAQTSLAINGTTTIKTGGGDDQLSISANGNLTFVKDVVISTDLNNDRVRIEANTGSIRFSGNEAVNLGDQNDGFLQGTTLAINTLLNPENVPKVSGTFRVDGNLSVTGGSGDDTIGLAGIQVGKNRPSVTAAFPASTTTIDGGAGKDVIGVSRSVVRDLKLLGGDDDDTVGSQDNAIRGTTNVDLGKGNDQLTIGGRTSLNDNVTVLGGTGDDQFAVEDSVTLTAGKKIAINGGTGVNRLKNNSAIPIAAFNPAPASWPAGAVDGAAIGKAIVYALQAGFQ